MNAGHLLSSYKIHTLLHQLFHISSHNVEVFSENHLLLSQHPYSYNHHCVISFVNSFLLHLSSYKYFPKINN